MLERKYVVSDGCVRTQRKSKYVSTFLAKWTALDLKCMIILFYPLQELTVKGLEQEISKLTNDHQREVIELKRHHQQEILDAVEEARQKHEALEMGIRETYAQDREAAIEKERNAIRERLTNITYKQKQ